MPIKTAAKTVKKVTKTRVAVVAPAKTSLKVDKNNPINHKALTESDWSTNKMIKSSRELTSSQQSSLRSVAYKESGKRVDNMSDKFVLELTNSKKVGIDSFGDAEYLAKGDYTKRAMYQLRE